MACRSVEAARRASRFEGNDKPVLGRDAIVSRMYRGAEILDVAEIGTVYRQTMQCLLRVAAGQRRVDLGYMGVWVTIRNVGGALRLKSSVFNAAGLLGPS